jgi:toxin ParE1/3/4
MSVVKFSETATLDLRDIWLYSAETWGPDQADRYTVDIEEICAELAAGRLLGRPVQERPGYFRHLAARHLIFFMESDEGIVVMRVLHQSMDIERHLS